MSIEEQIDLVDEQIDRIMELLDLLTETRKDLLKKLKEAKQE